MDTDRELLEWAAKAAGIAVEWDGDGFVIRVPFKGYSNYEAWNPLTDDGDALRLAVRLATLSPGASFGISISAMHDGRGFCSAGFFSRDNPTSDVVSEDISAATRRAITMAAAQIGRAMP